MSKMNFQGSSGFIYYSLEDNSKDESTDFISFNDSSTPKDNTFNPTSYSSPQEQNRKYPRAHNNSLETPYYYNGNNSGRGRRYMSFNNYPRTPNNKFRRSHSSVSFTNKMQENKYARYIHPSFTEDPWRHLVKAMDNKTEKINNEKPTSGTT